MGGESDGKRREFNHTQEAEEEEEEEEDQRGCGGFERREWMEEDLPPFF